MSDETMTDGADLREDRNTASREASATADWKAKYHGLRGSFEQYKKNTERELNTLREALDSLKSQVAERDGVIEELKRQVEELGGKAKDANTLREQVEALRQRADLAGKYEALMQFPELLDLQVEETVKRDDGSEEVVKTNPALRLVETSTLSGDELRAVLEQMVKAMPSAGSSGNNITAGAVPTASPEETAPQQTADAIQKKINELHALANAGVRYTDAGEDVLDKIADLYKQLRSL